MLHIYPRKIINKMNERTFH